MPVKAEGERRGFSQLVLCFPVTVPQAVCRTEVGRGRRALRKYKLNFKGMFLKHEARLFSWDKYRGGQQAVACRNPALVNN